MRRDCSKLPTVLFLFREVLRVLTRHERQLDDGEDGDLEMQADGTHTCSSY